VAQIRWMAYWTFRFQSWVVPSALPLASVCPPGLNATEYTVVPPLRGGPRSRGRAGSVMSHSRTVPWALPPASVCPPGLNATQYGIPVPPVSGWLSGRGRGGVQDPVAQRLRLCLCQVAVEGEELEPGEQDLGHHRGTQLAGS
jgi:hypothetical protein